VVRKHAHPADPQRRVYGFRELVLAEMAGNVGMREDVDRTRDPKSGYRSAQMRAAFRSSS
jgi:hypothetical protein